MIKPEAVCNVLEHNLHPVQVSHERIGPRTEKKYSYTLEFDDYKTLALLKEQTRAASELADLNLVVETIEPVLHIEDKSVEARIGVTVVETANRNEIENQALDDFVEGEA